MIPAIQDQLDASIRGNFFDPVFSSVFLFQNPESLHRVLKSGMRNELLIFLDWHMAPRLMTIMDERDLEREGYYEHRTARFRSIHYPAHRCGLSGSPIRLPALEQLCSLGVRRKNQSEYEA